MNTGLEGRTAVLSGAARTSGLGHAFSMALAREGVNIVIADLLDAGNAVTNIEVTGARALGVKCDVSNPEEIAKLRDLVTERFIRSVAREVGDFGITVNALSPGLVLTEGSREAVKLDPTYGSDPETVFAAFRGEQCIHQTLIPENLTGPLLFLASDQSAFVTGQTLLVDGGWQHAG